MQFLDVIRNKPALVKAVIAIFFSVGIAGFLYAPTNSFFIKLIPYALLLNFCLLVLFNETEINKKAILAFVIILCVSFAIEAIGVATGLIFGNYVYGNGLGIKLFDTPLIIAVNWLFMVYTSAQAVKNISVPPHIKSALAAAVMVVYDSILEQMAPKLDMWYWRDDSVPAQNYIAWFALAFLFHLLLNRLHVNIKNKIATMLLISQFLFFVILFFAPKLL